MTIMLVGNKSDLEAKRQVSYEQAQQFATSRGLFFCEVTAKDTEGVAKVSLFLIHDTS